MNFKVFNLTCIKKCTYSTLNWNTICFLKQILLCSLGCSWTHFIVLAGLEFIAILLSQPPECWDYRPGPPHPARHKIYETIPTSTHLLLDIFWHISSFYCSFPYTFFWKHTGLEPLSRCGKETIDTKEAQKRSFQHGSSSTPTQEAYS